MAGLIDRRFLNEMGKGNKRTKTVIAVAAALMVQACSYSVHGPIRPFQAGYLGDTLSCDDPTGIRTSVLEDRFVAAACASAAASSDNDLAIAMLETSFSMTNARCTDFFADKAGNQARANIVRSSVAPVLTLLTGVLSIVNIKNDVDGEKRADWERGLTLASTATLAGLTVYEENFLFSADNIDDVRGLTKHAMAQYRQTVLRMTNHTFDTSVDYALEYHMICTPGKIKSLVKQAIKDKKIEVIDRAAQPVVAGVAATPPDAGASLTIN
ncbi:hypothetical protein ACPVPU_10830 [Sphingomonas sp. CJ99]